MYENKNRTKESYFARRRLMEIPEDISLNHINASIFRLLNQTFPHLNHNNNKKVHNFKTPFD